jgi:hypothetical protein
MPTSERRTEVLTIRGLIDEAAQFTPGRCTSTFVVRRWPTRESTGYVIELLDAGDRPLHREPALVELDETCDPVENRRWRVTAYIGLRDDAVAVQLRHDDLVLWRREIPGPARVDVRIKRQRISREAPARLRIKYSEPADGAFLKVIYQWGERRFHVVDVVAPTEALEVRLNARPGGRACRFVVIYSNGLRAAAAATRTFSLDPLGPSLTILQPRPGTVLTLGQPLSLEGQVVDPERPGGARGRESLSWFVDGNPVGRGPVAGVERLPEGRHRVTLRYEAQQGAEVFTQVTVRRGSVMPADAWPPLDDWGSDHVLGRG